jgi:hypothetical protein
MSKPGQPLFPVEPSPEQMKRCSKRGCWELNPPEAEFCSRCGRALERLGATPTDEPGMEISLGRGKRILGLLIWLALVAVVAAVLVFLFVRFTASLRTALALVAFMLAYMAVMAWITMRRAQ